MPPRTAGRLNPDVTHYAILCAHDGLGYFVERSLEASASREAAITDIMAGQVERVEKVFCFNPAEHIADDVTEEIAIEIANRLDPAFPIRPELRDFIETNAGLDYAHGLAVEDRSFAVASMNAPLRPLAPDTHRRLLVTDMGRALVETNVDLGDERAAIIRLRRTHREGDVVALLDDAICHAREMMAALARLGG